MWHYTNEWAWISLYVFLINCMNFVLTKLINKQKPNTVKEIQIWIKHTFRGCKVKKPLVNWKTHLRKDSYFHYNILTSLLPRWQCSDTIRLPPVGEVMLVVDTGTLLSKCTRYCTVLRLYILQRNDYTVVYQQRKRILIWTTTLFVRLSTFTNKLSNLKIWNLAAAFTFGKI